jgi:hypothetical protein
LPYAKKNKRQKNSGFAARVLSIKTNAFLALPLCATLYKQTKSAQKTPAPHPFKMLLLLAH